MLPKVERKGEIKTIFCLFVLFYYFLFIIFLINSKFIACIWPEMAFKNVFGFCRFIFCSFCTKYFTDLIITRNKFRHYCFYTKTRSAIDNNNTQNNNYIKMQTIKMKPNGKQFTDWRSNSQYTEFYESMDLSHRCSIAFIFFAEINLSKHSENKRNNAKKKKKKTWILFSLLTKNMNFNVSQLEFDVHICTKTLNVSIIFLLHRCRWILARRNYVRNYRCFRFPK